MVDGAARRMRFVYVFADGTMYSVVHGAGIERYDTEEPLVSAALNTFEMLPGPAAAPVGSAGGDRSAGAVETVVNPILDAPRKPAPRPEPSDPPAPPEPPAARPTPEPTLVVRQRAIAILEVAVFGVITAIFGAVAVGAFSDHNLAGTLPVAILTVVLLVVTLRSAFGRAVADTRGVHIRNLVTSRRVSWERVGGFDIAPLSSSSGLWWGVVLLLAGNDRVIHVQSSFTHRRDTAEAMASQLRAAGPDPAAITDRIGGVAQPLPLTGRGGDGRFVARAPWWSTQATTIAMGVWLGSVTFLGLLVSGALLFSTDGSPLLGGIVLGVTTLQAALVARLCGGRVIISAQGLQLRYPRRRLSWDEVTSMTVVEDLNVSMTRRRLRLVVATCDGAAVRGAGAWRTSELASVVEAIDAVAPLPRVSEPQPQPTEKKPATSFWAVQQEGEDGLPGS